MAVVRRTIDLPVAEVFDALVTPETYPHWLVGAREIRAVDDGWPQPGRAFHHRVGLAGPITIADLSKVLEIDAPRLLSLEVRARPLGRGRATFRLRGVDRGGEQATEVELDEVPLGLLAHATPLLDPLTERRNQRSLEQLDDFLLAGRTHLAPS